ncbi:MAG: coproporphyrinogen III oxidase [Chlamydiae bacterium]|nr:coproporphyrinogen III oxidase [Chlamydiota bacterium]
MYLKDMMAHHYFLKNSPDKIFNNRYDIKHDKDDIFYNSIFQKLNCKETNSPEDTYLMKNKEICSICDIYKFMIYFNHKMEIIPPFYVIGLIYIETPSKAWFGGGYDLTPMGFVYEEDNLHFHATAKQTLDPFGEHLYKTFSQQAKDYFFIPHRKKERGVGGIFFDHLCSGDFKHDINLWMAIGNTFLNAILPIYQKRIGTPFSKKDKELQQKLRAHYVEFNLLYDRGTKFGFNSGGNPEAILCSMPPHASW